MIGHKVYNMPINISDVRDTFNKKHRWQKYKSVYHSGTTYYYWNKYSVEYKYLPKHGSEGTYTKGTTYTLYSSSVFNPNRQTFDISGQKTITLTDTTQTTIIGLYKVQVGDGWYGNFSHRFEKVIQVSDTSIKYSITTEGVEYFKGSVFCGTVSSVARSDYPTDSRKNGYWYVYSHSSTSAGYYSKGTYIEDIEAKEENAYPSNGRHSDGYWYVKVE